MGMTDFSDQFRKLIVHHKRNGNNLNTMQQSACLVITSITVDNLDALLNCMPVDRAPDSMTGPHKAIHISWLGQELFRLLLGPSWLY